MSMKLLSTAIITVTLTLCGSVFAGPGGKGKVVIEHAPPSDKGKGVAIVDGSVEIEVSVPAAISHLEKHEGDCIASDENGLLDNLGYDDCGFSNEPE